MRSYHLGWDEFHKERNDMVSNKKFQKYGTDNNFLQM